MSRHFVLNFRDAPQLPAGGGDWLPCLSPYVHTEYADIGIPTIADLELRVPPPLSWHARKPVAVFRGGMTGAPEREHNLRWRLCRLSHPRLDARLTGCNRRMRWCADGSVARAPPLERPAPFLPLEGQAQYRYAVTVDGNVGANRLGAQLAMRQAVFLPDTDLPQVWFHPLLQPWVHIVPVDHQLADLPQLLDTPDEVLRRVADAGHDLWVSRLDPLRRLSDVLRRLPPTSESQRERTEHYLWHAAGRFVRGHVDLRSGCVTLTPLVNRDWRNDWGEVRFSRGLSLSGAVRERGALTDPSRWWSNWGVLCSVPQSEWGASQLPLYQAALERALCL